MIRLSKKVLSVLVCLSLLISVVAVMFVSPVSAVSESQTVGVFTEGVNLTFDGDAKYGLPVTRGATVQYFDGYATMSNSGVGGCATFIGLDGTYGETTVNRTSSMPTDADLLAQLYKVVPGKIYKLTFDFRYLEGTNVIDFKPIVYISLDPTTAAGEYHSVHTDYTNGPVELNASNKMLQSLSSNIPATDWTVNGEVKEVGYLLAEGESTPWQTGSVTFSIKDELTSGVYIGIRHWYYATAGYAGNVAFDNIKVEVADTSFAYNKISLDFDDNTAPAGLSAYDNGSTPTFADGVMTMDGSATRYSFNETQVITQNKKYYIEFDAKTTSGSSTMMLVVGNKGASSGSGRCYLTWQDEGMSYFVNGVATAKVSRDATFNVTDSWQHFGVIMDTSNEDLIAYWKNQYSGMFNSTSYLLIGGKNTQVDNLNIYIFDAFDDAVPEIQLDEYKQTKAISHNMEAETVSENVIENTANTTTFVDSGDADHGKVMELSSSGTRVTFTDTNMLVRDNRYTITFDAKTTNDSTSGLWMIMGQSTSTSNKRVILNNPSGSPTLSETDFGNEFVKYYINGEQKSRTDFKLSGEWQTFKIVVDFSDETFNNIIDTCSSDANYYDFYYAARYFHFGCANAWFDNFSMVEENRKAETIIENTEVSYREASGTGEEYISAGIRFKNYLPTATVEAADEIGFVVAPSSVAAAAADTWYNLDGTGSAAAKKVVCMETGYNRYYEIDGDNTYYQLVLTGLSVEGGDTAYLRRFSAVMYIKNGEEYTYYALGETSYKNIECSNLILSAYAAQ